jgi:protein with PEP-CTERM/exosortase system signal
MLSLILLATDISVVPDTGMTLALLGIGFGSIVFIRARFK